MGVTSTCYASTNGTHQKNKINIKINIKIASQVGRHCLGICLGGHLPGRAGVWWTRLARPAVRGSTGEGPQTYSEPLTYPRTAALAWEMRASCMAAGGGAEVASAVSQGQQRGT